MQSITALAAAVVAFFAVTLCAPLAAAALAGQWFAFEAFLICIFGYGFVSVLTLLALTPRLRRLNRGGVFTAAIVMWFALVVAALIPFMMVEKQGFTGALFEAISAAVTLGLTLHPSAEISGVMGLYRGVIAWQGGLLTLLLAVFIIGRYEVGGTPNRHLRLFLHSFQSGNPRILQTFIEVFVPYVALTLVCAALLVIVRVDPADAINLAINIVSTNGYVPLQTGASVLNNIAGELVLMVFMVLGATSIIWHRTLITRRWEQSREQTEVTVYLLSICAVVILSILVALSRSSDFGTPLAIIMNAVFDAVSTMTTTGITHDTRFGVILPFELILAIALVGGCSYSTAGGLKVFRVVVMLQHSANELKRLVYPHSVLANSVDGDPKVLKVAKAVWSASFVTLLTLVAAALVFAFQGAGLSESLGLAVGAFSSTANLVTGSLSETPDTAMQLTVAIVSLLGRLEMLIVVAALSQLAR